MKLREIESATTDNFPLTAPSITLHRIINNVYFDLSRPFTADMVESETFTAEEGKCTYELVKPARKIVQILWDGSRLRQVSRQFLILPKSSGTPTRWAPNGTQQESGLAARNNLRFEFDKLPDGEGEVTAQYEPAPILLSNTEDAPKFIPDDFHYLIAWGARHFLAAENGAWTDAQYWQDRYISSVADMLSHLGITAPDNYPTISVISDRLVGGDRR